MSTLHVNIYADIYPQYLKSILYFLLYVNQHIKLYASNSICDPSFQHRNFIYLKTYTQSFIYTNTKMSTYKQPFIYTNTKMSQDVICSEWALKKAPYFSISSNLPLNFRYANKQNLDISEKLKRTATIYIKYFINQNAM